MPDKSPLQRLRDAFARMTGAATPSPAGDAKPVDESAETGAIAETTADDEACPVSPRSILEAMLFVGHPDNEPLTRQEAAALMRGVEPAEIDDLVGELNTTYDQQNAPYTIASDGPGYRLVLRDQFDRVRNKFYGRIREARLSRACVEVLSLVAYHQPLTADTVTELRGAPSGPFLSQLVRRELLQIERPEDHPQHPFYRTTDRFLRVFGLASLGDLPQSEQIEQS